MRTTLVLILTIGVAFAAVPESRPHQGNWDDEDSMILPATTSKGFSSFSQVPDDERDSVNLDDRTRYISLLPASDPEHQESSQEENVSKLEPLPRQLVPPAVDAPTFYYNPQVSEPTTSNSQLSNEDSDSASSESTTTEKSERLHFVQLGKIPLTYEIIPLASSSGEYFSDKHVKPIGFFPEQVSGSVMMDKAKVLRREQEQQQKQHEMEDENTAPTEIKNDQLPPEPLTYLTPPKEDAETYWRQYPLESSKGNSEDSSENQNEATTLASLPSQTTLNPLLVRLNDFLQKAKRHLDDQEYLLVPKQKSQETSVETKETLQNSGDVIETATSSASTTEDSSSTEDLFTVSSTPSSLIHTSTEQDSLTPIKLIGVPETNKYESSFQPSQPYWSNSVSQPSSPSFRQSLLDYLQNGNNNAINKGYYSNPDIGVMTSMQPPKPLYSSSSIDSYLPRSRYLYESLVNGERSDSDYPFIRYGDYYRPERSRLVESTSPLVNSIPVDGINLRGIGYGNYGYGSRYGYANPRSGYSRRSIINSGPYLYDSYYPNSYPMTNYRQTIPYISSSNLVNSLMYAPSYPYQQYSQYQPQPEFF